MSLIKSIGERAAAEPRERRWIYHPYLLLMFRLVLAAVFIYAALQKIGKPLAFADEIHMYGVVDYGAPLYLMAIALPWLEILCGIALVTGIFLRGASLILLGLNALFLIVIALRTAAFLRDGMPFFKIYFDCGCGFGATYAWKKLLEDGVYFILSMILLFAPSHKFTVSLKRRSS